MKCEIIDLQYMITSVIKISLDLSAFMCNTKPSKSTVINEYKCFEPVSHTNITSMENNI